MLRILLCAAAFVTCSTAQACLFARDAQPKDWDEWAQALFAAEVTAIDEDRRKGADVIALRVLETFKGPPGASATLTIPSRMWEGCRLARPQVGAQVLGALNANGDALLVPLTLEYRNKLRESFRER